MGVSLANAPWLKCNPHVSVKLKHRQGMMAAMRHLVPVSLHAQQVENTGNIVTVMIQGRLESEQGIAVSTALGEIIP